jgi:hypothetical protein
MSRSFFTRPLRRILDALSPGGGHKKRRSRARRFTGLENLEGRALMATINASGVISSAAAGADTNYTINLTNASSSDAGIGTFWYAWVPDQDFLATSPISVSPPAGWTDNITNDGPGDGFGIQFLANGPANDVQPGSSLNFSFTSADSPASVNGNSAFYPSTPTSSSTVYPQGPFSDAGHELVVTPSQAPTPTPTPSPTPTSSTSPPVTVVNVQDVKGKKNLVNEIVVDLSGPVNAAQADNLATYRLAAANGTGSFTAKNSAVVKLRSAEFNPANDTITLTPRKAFALTKPVELTISGTAPSGLQDISGQLIDGDDNGTAGGNAVAVIRRTGVTLNPVAPVPAPPRATIPIIPTRPVVVTPTPTASPVAPSPTPTAPPVVVMPTPTAPPVVVTPTPTAPPGGPSYPYTIGDAVLSSGERMM